MPSIGNNIPVLTGAANYPLPDRYMSALRAGIRFFIIRYPKYVYTDQRVMGAFDVRCNEESMPGVENASYDMRWLTGVSAGVTFFIITDGLAVAHMPDDIYYHNRILLLTHPWMLAHAEGLLTREGVLAASQLNTEIQCLREYVWEPRVIYKVIRENGSEVTFQWTEEDAKKIIASTEKRTMNRTSLIEYKPYEKCHIVEGKKITWKPRFENMIRQYSRQPYGWTACPEFKEQVIPAVNQLIQQRMGGARPAPAAMDMEAMYEQFKARILSEIGSGKNPDFVSASPVVVPETPTPVQPAPQPAMPAPMAGIVGKTTYTKSKLHPMNKGELRDIGATMGIALDDAMTKDMMVGAILKEQDNAAPVVR